MSARDRGAKPLVETITQRGRRIEFARVAGLDASLPTLVFLHEGLGSLALWRDFPQRLAAATSHPALVYSRYGYGYSTPLREPRGVDFMHEEALVALPELLDALAIERPVLFGHSDGASIALIHAARARRPVTALVVMAPHIRVEPFNLESIRQVRETFHTTDLRERLGRYHLDVEATFRGWNDIWLHPEFVHWDIAGMLPDIAVPVLAIQGEQDPYGTMEQIDGIARLAPRVQLLKLASCRHSPHRDQPEAVLTATVTFLREVRQHT